jgi:hypothetical protein
MMPMSEDKYCTNCRWCSEVNDYDSCSTATARGWKEACGSPKLEHWRARICKFCKLSSDLKFGFLRCLKTLDHIKEDQTCEHFKNKIKEKEVEKMEKRCSNCIESVERVRGIFCQSKGIYKEDGCSNFINSLNQCKTCRFDINVSEGCFCWDTCNQKQQWQARACGWCVHLEKRYNVYYCPKKDSHYGVEIIERYESKDCEHFQNRPDTHCNTCACYGVCDHQGGSHCNGYKEKKHTTIELNQPIATAVTGIDASEKYFYATWGEPPQPINYFMLRDIIVSKKELTDLREKASTRQPVELQQQGIIIEGLINNIKCKGEITETVLLDIQFVDYTIKEQGGYTYFPQSIKYDAVDSMSSMVLEELKNKKQKEVNKMDNYPTVTMKEKEKENVKQEIEKKKEKIEKVKEEIRKERKDRKELLKKINLEGKTHHPRFHRFDYGGKQQVWNKDYLKFLKEYKISTKYLEKFKLKKFSSFTKLIGAYYREKDVRIVNKEKFLKYKKKKWSKVAKTIQQLIQVQEGYCLEKLKDEYCRLTKCKERLIEIEKEGICKECGVDLPRKEDYKVKVKHCPSCGKEVST